MMRFRIVVAAMFMVILLLSYPMIVVFVLAMWWVLRTLEKDILGED